MRFQTLDEWLSWQEQLHPSEIELGLERVRRVWQALRPDGLACPVISVAGTNGKGSSVAMLESILVEAGYRVGAYTSPHLLRYNERIRLDRKAVDDQALCRAFARIDQARGDISLTYFEFGTLAALDIFAGAGLDAAVLEVGLGGRLDAVNIIDAEVALLTPVDIDHIDWLGGDRDSIGREKAGIFRPRHPAVCTDPQPPQSVLDEAGRLGVELHCLGPAFGLQDEGETWSWHGPHKRLPGLPRPALTGDYQLQNAAGVLMVLECLRARLPVARDAIERGLTRLALAGRFQRIDAGRATGVEQVLDVGHNPHAARALATHLRGHPPGGRTRAVYAALADKDVESVVASLVDVVDDWYLAGLAVPRGLSAEALQQRVGSLLPTGPACFASVSQAWQQAMADAGPGDRVIGFGSFFTVAELQRLTL